MYQPERIHIPGVILGHFPSESPKILYLDLESSRRYASHELESRTTYASPKLYSKMLAFSTEGTKKAGIKGRFRVSGKKHEAPQIWDSSNGVENFEPPHWKL